MPASEVALEFDLLRETAESYLTHGARRRAAGAHADEVEAPEFDFAALEWVKHLLKVDSRLKTAPAVGRSLKADVAAGLDAIAAARAAFLQKHKSCPGCGIFIPNGAGFCICGWKRG